MRTDQSITAARAHLARIAPSDRHVEFFGAGNDGALFLAGDTLYKVATNDATGERLRRESRLLRQVADRLSVPVPIPVELPEDESSPTPVTVAYPLIRGRELPTGLLSAHSQLARQAAAFLTSLHDIDPTPLGGILDVRCASSELARVRKATSGVLASTLSTSSYGAVVDWWETSEERIGEWPAASLVHGDFWSGNIIVDDALESLRGVVDFADAHIGDPAEDFAALFHSGPRFTHEVLRAYSRQRPGILLDALMERASWWWEMRELRGLADGLRVRDRQLIDDTLAKLMVGPLFDARSGFAAVGADG